MTVSKTEFDAFVAEARGRDPMAHFNVAPIHDNSKTMVVGYKVWSSSRYGGPRIHHTVEGQHAASLESAKLECESIAAKLEAEAAANRSRRA